MRGQAYYRYYQHKGTDYEDYVASGVWKCEYSLTGAHHYKLDSDGNGNCIYCGKGYKAEMCLGRTVA